MFCLPGEEYLQGALDEMMLVLGTTMELNQMKMKKNF